MIYADLLAESYERERKKDPELGKFEFLACRVFGFTTYEKVTSSLMAARCLDVCLAISQRKTLEYISSEDGHLWYMLMVNMPFFAERLEWGTSIRGAWWIPDRADLKSYGLFYRGEQRLEIHFNKEQWLSFIDAMSIFATEEQ